MERVLLEMVSIGGKDRGSTHPDIAAGETTRGTEKTAPTRQGKSPPVYPFSGKTPFNL